MLNNGLKWILARAVHYKQYKKRVSISCLKRREEMKTLNWKDFVRKTSYLALTASMIVACGSDNKTNSGDANQNYHTPGNYDPNTGGYTPGSGSGSGNLPSNVQQDMQYLKQQWQCGNGGRLQDIHMHVPQGGASQTSIYGQFQQGHASGSHQATFAGANYGTHDLIFVTKVSNGGQIAYNFTVSLCPQPHGGLDQGTQFQYFEMQNYFVLDHNAGCTLGNVDAGDIRFVTHDQYFGPRQHNRAFSKVCFQ